VLVLDADNFDKEVARHTQGDASLLVEFYAPWCGHCKSLEPKYKEAAAELIKKSPPLRIAKVDADDSKNKDLASKHGVSGFPTLKVFKDGGATVSDYEGGREKRDIVEAVINAQGPTWTEVNSKQEVDEKAKQGKPVLLFAGREPRAGSKAFTHFKTAAAKLKGDFECLGVFDTEVAKTLGIDPPGAVILTSYKAEGERKEHLKVVESSDQILNFAYNFGKPLAVLTSSPSENKLLGRSSLPVLHMVVPSGDANRKNMYKNRMSKVAEKYKEKLSFAVSDDKESRLMEEYGLENTNLPTMVIREESSKYKFSASDEESLKFKATTISAFVDDFLAKKLEKFLKSEALPNAPTDSDPVQVVVGKNFEEVVMDKSKNVLLEMYAPWCGHCKKLEPEYKAAAKKIRKLAAKNPEKWGDVVLAKFDATANDSPVEDLQARGYPTIKFIKAGANEIKDFGGERDSKGIVAYIKKEIGA